jgi:hypothetical protein
MSERVRRIINAARDQQAAGTVSYEVNRKGCSHGSCLSRHNIYYNVPSKPDQPVIAFSPFLLCCFPLSDGVKRNETTICCVHFLSSLFDLESVQKRTNDCENGKDAKGKFCEPYRPLSTT